MTAAPAASVDRSVEPGFRSVARSHVGAVRAINEDRVFHCPERGLWAVADGMGGHRGGDLAAQAVVDGLRRLIAAAAELDEAALVAALAQAGQAIVARNVQTGAASGATVVAAVAERGMLRVAWAGDSRAYLIRDGAAAPLTRDHSVVQDLVDAGLIDADQAERHPQANVVTRALGVGDGDDIERTAATLQGGDRILLCSDGLSRSLRDGDLVEGGPIDALADRLIGNALRRDGSDNASLVLIEVAAAD